MNNPLCEAAHCKAPYECYCVHCDRLLCKMHAINQHHYGLVIWKEHRYFLAEPIKQIWDKRIEVLEESK